MKENEFRYLVLSALVVLANYIHRSARNFGRLADTDQKDIEALVERLSVAKEEAMK